MAKQIIDVTPKWENLVPMFIGWIQEGTLSQREEARKSITQLATIADTFMVHRKHGGLTCKCGDTFELGK